MSLHFRKDVWADYIDLEVIWVPAIFEARLDFLGRLFKIKSRYKHWRCKWREPVEKVMKQQIKSKRKTRREWCQGSQGRRKLQDWQQYQIEQIWQER